MTFELSRLLERLVPGPAKAIGRDGTESEERYRSLIETSPAPINLFDANGEVVWGNDAVLELLGLDSRDDLVGRSIFEFIHPEDRYTAEQELLAVVEEKVATGPTNMQLHRDDGTIKQIRVSTAPGRYDGIDIGQAVVVDVTPMNELQEELRRERSFAENAIDTLPDAFYVVGIDGNLKRWNDVLPDVSGYSIAEIADMAIEEFFVEDHRNRVSEAIARAFVEGGEVIEATVRTKHGAEIPYEFRKRRLIIEGEIVGLVGIGRDVSDRKARDQHLRTVDRLLQHNLRNQLNIIQAWAGLVRRRSADTDTDSLDRIDHAADRLLSIFDHHSHIVNLLTGKESPGPVDVVPVIESIVRTERQRHPSAHITCALPESAVVSAVPEIDRLLGELIENAIVHNDDPEPAVDVDVCVDESTVTIRVEDECPTIPEMERDVVAGDATIGPTFHSQGLGLWFVHWVVERSGGTLSFSDAETGGNEVTITLLRSRSASE